MKLKRLDPFKVASEAQVSITAARVYCLIYSISISSQRRGIRDQRGIPFCYASNKFIAKKIQKSERTVYRAVKQLKDAGMLEVRRTKFNAHKYIKENALN